MVFLHGLCESEDCWDRAREELGTTYPSMLAERDWTPVLLRANTGLSLRENGAALTALLQRLVDEWPAEVHRIALVGHSMGGLVLRAATAVATEAEASWTRLVSDVVTLGAPHLGAPLAGYVGHGSRALARSRRPQRSAGSSTSARSACTTSSPAWRRRRPLPRARYRLVSGWLGLAAAPGGLPPRRPAGAALLGVRPQGGREDLFPDADVLHVPRAGHFALLNHPEVHRALAEWLA